MFGWRKRIGYICSGPLMSPGYAFYLVAPEGVGLFALPSPIEDWRNDEYERSLARIETSRSLSRIISRRFHRPCWVPPIVSQGREFMRRFLCQIEEKTGLPASTSINSAMEAFSVPWSREGRCPHYIPTGDAPEDHYVPDLGRVHRPRRGPDGN